MEMTETRFLPSGSLQSREGEAHCGRTQGVPCRNAILGGENATSQPDSEQLERLKPGRM